ncbi:MAG: tRNA 2-selenouridine(34) synthase MnmH [Bacteroidetes bacterium CG2_30_32_10]|nr:MAG: tRNA 2-selenouridine(34) synthase MnmH [Bacteroidetes bacterium CG2_30_32_10]
MSSFIEAEEFIRLSSHIPIVDVRSPIEFAKGHITKAINIPLFSDEQRVVVGIKYKQEGQQAAIITGLELIGSSFADKCKEALKIAKNKELLIHCWKGGLRSESMAWLFETIGIKTYILKGGYKSYKSYIRKSWETPFKVIVLGGYTGSGKTEILHALQRKNQQIIDLEKLAHHKGSAFGALGQEEQPTNEQFENDLYDVWSLTNHHQYLWLEDESQSIGRVRLPDLFFETMNNAPLIRIQLSHEIRIHRLVNEYACFNKEQLSLVINKISKKIGSLLAKNMIETLYKEDFAIVASLLLEYYDNTYEYSISKRKNKQFQCVTLPNDNADGNALLMMESIKNIG